MFSKQNLFVFALVAVFGAQNIAQAAETLSQREVLTAIRELGDEGASGIAEVIEAVFREKGRPVAVIVGKDFAGGALLGYRKGKGKVVFKGDRTADAEKIYWRGASVAIGAAVNGGRVAILVYNVRAYEDIIHSYQGVEGSAHLVAGSTLSYLRDNLDDERAPTLAYVQFGVGLGARADFSSVKFTRDNQWFPGLDF